MKIVNIPFDKIDYDSKDFDDSLKESILRISFIFPIYVRKGHDGYQCIDGHKRLSVIKWLKDHENHQRNFTYIPSIIQSDDRTDIGYSRKRHH